MIAKILVLSVAVAMVSAKMCKLLEAQKEFIPACEEETGFKIPEEKEGEKPDMQMEMTHDANCFSKCIATKAGAFSEDGVPNVNKMKELLKMEDEEKLKEVVQKCKEDVPDEDMCDKVGKIASCIVKNLFHNKPE